MLFLPCVTITSATTTEIDDVDIERRWNKARIKEVYSVPINAYRTGRAIIVWTRPVDNHISFATTLPIGNITRLAYD
ncbi:MAG: hypothetical protein NXI12_08035, partial [Alphaproteobacteria bacterium]|nr:hypothetical protein [Alphaproteobacteria bacterium]